MTRTGAQRGWQGFTLIESLLASAILVMTITAVTMPFTAAARNAQADARRTVAVDLAQEIMEEMLSQPFADPDGTSVLGPEIGESARADFDNIDDYHGYTEPAGTITAGDGSPADDPVAGDLSRHVTAAYVFVSGQSMLGPPTFIRVQVEIRRNNLPIVTLTRMVYDN